MVYALYRHIGIFDIVTENEELYRYFLLSICEGGSGEDMLSMLGTDMADWEISVSR